MAKDFHEESTSVKSNNIIMHKKVIKMWTFLGIDLIVEAENYHGACNYVPIGKAKTLITLSLKITGRRSTREIYPDF